MKPAAQTLTFALDASKVLRHVDEVANGLACGCTCPGCGEALVAKQGQKTQHHFSHSSGADCSTAIETALHLAAKEILMREKRMQLPELVDPVVGGLAPSKLVQFDAVEDEVWLGELIPDIVAKIRNRQLLIEIAVTHFVDDEKLAKIKSKDLAAIEIDLSDLKTQWDWVKLKAAIIDGKGKIAWLHNPKSIALAQAKAEAARKEWERTNARVDVFQKAELASQEARLAFEREQPQFAEAVNLLNQFESQGFSGLASPHKQVRMWHVDLYRLLSTSAYMRIMTTQEKGSLDRLESAIKEAIKSGGQGLNMDPDDHLQLQNQIYRRMGLRSRV